LINKIKAEMGRRGRKRKTKGFFQLFLLIIFILPLLLIVAVACADEGRYLYDSLGRLQKVIKEDGSAAIYHYDEVGNLISIEHVQTSNAPPELDSLSPDLLFRGTPFIIITITGRNLLALEELYTDNPGIYIHSFQSTDDTITAEVSINSDAPLGDFMFYVKTFYGEASIGFTVATLRFNPDRLLMKVGDTATVEVSIEPPVDRDQTFTISNPQPQALDVPQEVTVPQGGIGIFQVVALKEATVVLKIRGVRLPVWVTGPLQGEVYLSSGPVSVGMSLLIRNNTKILSSQVSVDMSFPRSILTDSVSVQMPFEGMVVSDGVCIEIEK